MKMPLPIIPPPDGGRAHPLTIIAIYAAAGVIVFALTAMIYQLIYQP